MWRRAHDRFRRAVDRYHGVLEHVPEGALRAGLESTGAQLAAALDLVHTVCVRAQAVGPSAGDDVPAGQGGVLLDVHRALTRSATLAAQAAEAVTLVVVAGGGDEAQTGVVAAARAAGQARSQVSRAEALLASVDTGAAG